MVSCHTVDHLRVVEWHRPDRVMRQLGCCSMCHNCAVQASRYTAFIKEVTPELIVRMTCIVDCAIRTAIPTCLPRRNFHMTISRRRPCYGLVSINHEMIYHHPTVRQSWSVHSAHLLLDGMVGKKLSFLLTSLV